MVVPVILSCLGNRRYHDSIDFNDSKSPREPAIPKRLESSTKVFRERYIKGEANYFFFTLR